LPADSHAAQLIWNKEDVGYFRRFKPHAAPGATNLIRKPLATSLKILTFIIFMYQFDNLVSLIKS
jgi:hypothetical protein